MPNSGGLTTVSLCTELLEGIIAGVMPSHVLLFRLLANAVSVSECVWAPAVPVKANSVPWSNISVRFGSISLSFRIGCISCFIVQKIRAQALHLSIISLDKRHCNFQSDGAHPVPHFGSSVMTRQISLSPLDYEGGSELTETGNLIWGSHC